MKNEYLVLWIDDALNATETDREHIYEHLLTVGIKTNYVLADGGNSGIHDIIQDTLDNKELDILVIDYHMPGLNGDQLINQIRTTDNIFLPIIFYSQNGVDQLRTAAAGVGLEGVFFAHRDNIENKFIEVSRSLLRSEQTIKRTRGLLMEGVSEMDAGFHELSLAAWNKLDDTNKAAVITYYRGKVEERLGKAQELLNEVPADAAEFLALLQTTFTTQAFDTVMRWKIIKKMLELGGADATLRANFTALYEGGTPPELPLIRLRNNYAHKTREELNTTHTDNQCTYIRNELRRQMENNILINNGLVDPAND